jgi:membrane protein involved in colicin uptake
MKNLFLIIILVIASNCAFGQAKTKAKPTDTAQRAPAATSTAFRAKFDDIFKRNNDGSFSPIKSVQINGVVMGSDVPFNAGTTFGGVDVGAYEGHDMLIDTVKSVVIIRSFVK